MNWRAIINVDGRRERALPARARKRARVEIGHVWLSYAGQSSEQLALVSVPVHIPSPHIEQSCAQLWSVSVPVH